MLEDGASSYAQGGMPPYVWRTPFESRTGGGYLQWAMLTVEGLHWLADMDDRAFAGGRVGLQGHPAISVDIAHARWATASAISAIDLCGAELAVKYLGLGYPPSPDQTPTLAQLDANRLPSQAQLWVAGVKADPQYGRTKRARNGLIHRLLVRTAWISPTPGPPAPREAFATDQPDIPDHRLSAGELVVVARDMATAHVEEFHEASLQGRF